MKLNNLFISAIVASTILISCSDDNNEPQLPKGDYENGILVTNEGAFSGGTGTINYISDDYKTEEAAVFEKVNNETLGTVVQSIGFSNQEAYIVANVANKISVANRYTMKKNASITTGLSNPRYIAFANGKGYVTNWGDGAVPSDDFVAVIDLKTNTVTKKISVVEGPERIVANGDRLYISHKGGFGSGSSITVVNALTDSIEKNITVGSIPDELFFTSSGDLMVSCEGKAVTQWNPTEVLAKISVISTSLNTVIKTIEMPTGVHPNTMVNANGKIYFSSNGKVYEMNESSATYNAKELFATPVYTMSVRNEKLYTTDAKDYASNGTLKIWNIATKTEEKSFTVGLIPGGVYFNE